ncbi:conserved hypothetical protein [Leishmania major strain Friedlin]|uniref:Centrosomal protein of 162 kDa n=1 Tax=Leishmania major TaxID=5664 RepID=Q4QB41_LEIMA|nr:conserved hypothetical protein [Leishmania major strain Friedlin]CAJ04744.1 conserved hypothetical protein [Leishmania major strain Friedlin]|eukprot:XP_001683457.1 conserved hypothetical protein [Leishmania major strain Friedlin]
MLVKVLRKVRIVMTAPSSSTAAVDSTNELLDVMDSNVKNASTSSIGSEILSASGRKRSSDLAPAPAAGAEKASATSEAALKPSTGPTESSYFTSAMAHGSFDAVRKEMETQEKIIATLQRDNESLLREKKEILSRCKQLEHDFEHLEAKHSLLLSAQQDFAVRSNMHTANDSAKIVNLQAQVEELQTNLETEKRRCALLLQERNDLAQSKSDTPSLVGSAEITNVAVVREQQGRSEDIVAKLRESQRIHSIQKSTIDALHSEVTRLESERKVSHSRESNLLREVDSLRTQVRDLESALQQKKGGIRELMSSCQAGSANAQRLKKQETRIRLLEKALLEKDEFTKRAMEELRAEAKKVCERYQSTVAELRQRLEVPKDDPELQKRISTLERENLDLRRALGGASVSLAVESAQPVQKLATEPKHHTDVTDKADKPGGQALKAPGSHELEITHLHSVIERLRAEICEHKQRNITLQSKLDSIHAEWDARLAEMKTNFALQIQTLRSAHNEELSRLEASHQTQLLEISKCSKADRGDSLASRLSRIVEEKGYDASLIAIGERLCFLEKRYCQKEEEKTHELLEMKRVAELEMKIQKEKTDLLLEQKNTQIKRFQVQLDELLAALSILQATS